MIFKKEIPSDKIVIDKDKRLKELLVELNLMDINNLYELAQIEKQKKQEETLESFLRELQPELLRNIKQGNSYFKFDEMPLYNFRNKYVDTYAIFARLKKYGILIELRHTRDVYGMENTPLIECNGWVSVQIMKKTKEE